MAKARERKDDLERNFSAAVEYAIQNRPDLFLIAGDVFDRVSPSNAPRIFLTEKVRQLKEAGISVFAIGGNHDVPKISGQPLAVDVLSSAGLATVFSGSDDFDRQILEVNGKRVCVAGKSYFSRVESENPLSGRKIPIQGDYNVLMIHGSLQGLNVVSSVPEMASMNPFGPQDIKPGLNYLALGHFHNYFDREYEDCKIVNSGSMERLSWAEINDEKGFVWAELDGSDISTEFIKLKTRPMERQFLHLTREEAYLPTIQHHVIDHIRAFSDPPKIVRLCLQGQITQEQYKTLKINEVLQATSDALFHLEIDRTELEVEGFGRVFLGRIENPVEAFVSRLDRLIEKAATPEERRHLEEARTLGKKYLEENPA